MNKQRRIVIYLAGLVLIWGSSAMADVTIETVSVGNIGNADDSTGYGAVDYAYNIGKYEVTAGQYTEFLNAVAGVDTYGLYNTNMGSNSYGCKIYRSGSVGSYTYSVAAEWVNRPVNYVSWGDAARFANWLHNGQPTGVQNVSTTEDGAYFLNGATTDPGLLAITRKADSTWVIPAEDEWYKAAYHKNDGITSNYFLYPTSNDTAPSNDLIDPDPGNNATFYASDYTIGSPYYLTEVGAHENSESPYDTLDQAGNVWEWNEADLFGSNRGLRGGSVYDSDVAMDTSYRYYKTPTTEGSKYGFRIAEIPAPILCSGDANRDGVVSAGDYATVQANFGNTGDPGILGDANGDGVVSAGDYASVQANFGNTAPTQTIPEPATLGLLGLGGLAILIRRKRTA